MPEGKVDGSATGAAGGSWRALLLPTVSFVLGVTTLNTFLFFLVPAYTRAHDLHTVELWAYTVNAVASMAMAIPAGRLVDAIPRRQGMRLGWALQAAGALMLVVAPPGPWPLLGGCALVGFGLCLGFVAFQSYVADVLLGAALANGYGVTSALSVLGSAAGPLAGAAVIAAVPGEAGGVQAVAVMVGGLSIAAMVLTYLLASARTAASGPGAPPRFGLGIAALQAFDPRPGTAGRRRYAARERRYLFAYAAASALLGLGFGLTVPWMGPHLLDHHALPSPVWGSLLGWSTALGALAIYLGGLLAGRTRHIFRLSLLQNAAAAVALVVFAFAPTAGLAALAFVGRQFFGSVTSPILNTGLMREVGEETRGRAFGVMNFAWNLPWAVGAAAGGPALDRLGGIVFAAGALFLVGGPLVGYLMNTRNRREWAEGISSPVYPPAGLAPE